MAGGLAVRNVFLIAGKEIQEAMRNRWVLATTLLLATLALTLTLLGSAPTGTVGVRALDVVIVSLSSLSIFLLPLIALLISHDAIAGEVERGTMLLLLSYPVGRWQVLIGKFAGHLAILAFATSLGYGLAALVLAATGAAIDASSLAAFAMLIGSSVLLGAVFISVGYLVSALVRERATAAGIVIGIWLLLVIIYDMALLGLLVLDQGRTISAGVLNALLLANPTDGYRMFNLSGSNVSLFSGMAGLADAVTLNPFVLLVALLSWALLPLGLAAIAFSRREL
jgi:Cu-processing system permease protein